MPNLADLKILTPGLVQTSAEIECCSWFEIPCSDFSFILINLKNDSLILPYIKT
ncbi:hypothetical protein GCD22_00277 [Acidithiobacillus thiooxidans ATCC 19377]|uniref:Uncharacterized protein n=1 Tax=Acidithiobacillus thiooxidans ATCC 19377 TaxID=637390 RepID=A0A5P9XM75_ACITH|nr:hypothetical protein GCD22_00277 [Acidithiobacillus thiooxidans ATCC 19377]